MSFPLPSATLCDVGLAADPLDRLFHIIDEHVATGRYPGAQIAIARNGQLAVVKTFGDRTIDPARAPAHDDTRSEEHTSELQSHHDLVCRLLLEKKKNKTK